MKLGFQSKNSMRRMLFRKEKTTTLSKVVTKSLLEITSSYLEAGKEKLETRVLLSRKVGIKGTLNTKLQPHLVGKS